jgi:FKBP-type peptidyl-prolyl cis-trans isomerase FklB
MRKTTIIAVTILAASTVLLGDARAQQTPATTTPATPAAKAQTTPAAKMPATPAAKTPTTAAKTPAANPLTTDKQKASYALGLNIARGLKSQAVDVDPLLLQRGIRDGLAGKPLLTDQQAQAALTQLQAQSKQMMEAKMAQLGDANKKEGEAFLAANKTKPGVVALPDGLQYKIVKEGTGPKPAATDTVECNYRGTLLDGTEFDSSYKRKQTATFALNQVIKGWTEAVQLMPAGSTWELYIPSDLAYGARGAGPIGPNSTLIFQVELVSIKGSQAAPANPAK